VVELPIVRTADVSASLASFMVGSLTHDERFPFLMVT
jgi:hypothetical protein